MIAIALAMLAAAESIPAGIPLWGGLLAGMTKAEVKALYPKKRAPITEGCSASIQPNYSDGKIESVNLSNHLDDTSARCGELVLQAIVEKYGEPQRTDEKTEYQSCGYGYNKVTRLMASLCRSSGGDSPLHYSLAEWRTDRLIITMRRNSENTSEWLMLYRPTLEIAKDIKDKF